LAIKPFVHLESRFIDLFGEVKDSLYDEKFRPCVTVGSIMIDAVRSLVLFLLISASFVPAYEVYTVLAKWSDGLLGINSLGPVWRLLRGFSPGWFWRSYHNRFLSF